MGRWGFWSPSSSLLPFSSFLTSDLTGSISSACSVPTDLSALPNSFDPGLPRLDEGENEGESKENICYVSDEICATQPS